MPQLRLNSTPLRTNLDGDLVDALVKVVCPAPPPALRGGCWLYSPPPPQSLVPPPRLLTWIRPPFNPSPV